MAYNKQQRHVFKDTLNILQINLQRSKVASSEALQMVHDLNVDILAIQEPYISNNKVAMLGSSRVLTLANSSSVIKSGLVIYNKDLLVHLMVQHCTQYYTTMKVETDQPSLYIISFYCSPAEDLRNALGQLGTTMNCLHGYPVLLMGDFNAKSHLWHSSVEDLRGYLLCEFMAAYDLTSLNDSPLPTFSASTGESWIDVSLGNPILLKQKVDCSTLDITSASDHSYILTSIKGGKVRNTYRIINRTNWDHFKHCLTSLWRPLPFINLNSKEDLDNIILDLTNTIHEALYLTTKVTVKKVDASWWDEDLKKKRKEVRRCKCKFRKETDPYLKEQRRLEYLDCYKQYKHLINTSRTRSWKNFCTNKCGDNPWSVPYYTVRSEGKSSSVPPP
ncbi:uncharacterized protein [Centruroides vittatus]|uniref:uncharacterized protein n=1 Tax=Centruroides vittatus TaxID=120091 RepID=UPI00350F5B3A